MISSRPLMTQRETFWDWELYEANRICHDSDIVDGNIPRGRVPWMVSGLSQLLLVRLLALSINNLGHPYLNNFVSLYKVVW